MMKLFDNKNPDNDNIVFEQLSEIIVIPNKKKIVVSLKLDANTKAVIGVDVRWYKLYAKGGKYDGKIKPTSKGICFEIGLLDAILNILLGVYKDVHGCDFRG